MGSPANLAVNDFEINCLNGQNGGRQRHRPHAYEPASNRKNQENDEFQLIGTGQIKYWAVVPVGRAWPTVFFL